MGIAFTFWLVFGMVLGLINFTLAGRASCNDSTHGKIANAGAFVIIIVPLLTLGATLGVLGKFGGLGGAPG